MRFACKAERRDPQPFLVGQDAFRWARLRMHVSMHISYGCISQFVEGLGDLAVKQQQCWEDSLAMCQVLKGSIP